MHIYTPSERDRERRCQSSAQQIKAPTAKPSRWRGGRGKTHRHGCQGVFECVCIDFCAPTRSHQSVHPHRRRQTDSQTARQSVSPLHIDSLTHTEVYVEKEMEGGCTHRERGVRTPRPAHTHVHLSSHTQPAIRSIRSTRHQQLVCAGQRATEREDDRQHFATLLRPQNTHTHTEGGMASADQIPVCLWRTSKY